MTVGGKITDDAGLPLPGATAAFCNQNGEVIGNSTAADDDGLFYLSDGTNSPDSKYYYVLLTSVGYIPVIVPLDVLVSSSRITLDRDYNYLPGVVVTPQKKSNNNLILFGVIAAAIVLYASSQKK